MAVRKIAHRLGLRFRLHRKDLPGTPDMVFPRHRTVVFVHGCYWHRHRRCRKATTPKSNVEFWTEKFHRNVERDDRKRVELEADGWRVETIWECETKNVEPLLRRLEKIFNLSGVGKVKQERDAEKQYD